MATLAEEWPLAAVVANDMLVSTCSTCFTHKPGQSLLRCTRCRAIHYCTRDCQKKDWKDHKFECMYLEKCSPRVPVSIARLMCRIALKQSAGPLPQAFNGRTWDTMMDHKAEIQKDPERAEFFICVSHVLYEFMGPEMVPKPADLITSFGRIIVNCFSITDSNSGLVTLGEGVYIGLSAHDHSCAPDCFITFDGAKAILRSPRRDIGYSTQLTICYTDLMATTSTRQQALKRQYYFNCNCSLCLNTTRDQWGRSAYASCCAGGLCLVDSRTSLSCYFCGSPSTLNPDDVETANLELDLFLNKDKMGQNLPVELGKALEIRYLPPGHPELANRLMTAAISASFAEPPIGQTLEMFQEAYDAALLSYGPRHVLTSKIDHLLSQYKIRLQRDLDA